MPSFFSNLLGHASPGVAGSLQATQQHFSEGWFRSNYPLSPLQSVNVIRFLTSIRYILTLFAKLEFYRLFRKMDVIIANAQP